MEIPDNLLCLFSANVEEQRGSYVIEIPKNEITNGAIRSGETYRAAILSAAADAETESDASPSKPDRTEADDTQANGGVSNGSESNSDEASGTEKSQANRNRDASKPPVEEGEVREVDIDDIGEQGDGITRVERGFVVIVPDTEKGERVTVEITDVQPNVAFGEVKERQTHF